MSKLSFPLISVPKSRIFSSNAFDITTKDREYLPQNYKDVVWGLSRDYPGIMKKFQGEYFILSIAYFFLSIDEQ